MFFDDLSQIPELARKTGFSILVVNQSLLEPIPTKDKKSKSTATSTSRAHSANNPLKSDQSPAHRFPELQTYVVPPKADNNIIGIDEIRLLIDHCKIRQPSDYFIVFENASALTDTSQDAMLKLFEEPHQNYHFVIFTSDLSLLLETILSRASIFIHCQRNYLQTPPAVDQATLDLAKRLLSTGPRDLNAFATEITSKKFTKDPRKTALAITTTAIELAYKYYFSTRKPAFLKKLSSLLTLEQNLEKNGNVKLHLVADLL